MTEATSPGTRLQNFPISIFSVVMGLAGFVIATQRIEDLLGITTVPGTVLLGVTLLVFLLFIALYALKMLRHPRRCLAEFNDPVRIGFSSTFSVSLLLVSVALLPISKQASLVVWIIGAVLHLLLTLASLTMWVQRQGFETKYMSPVWFIPVVGNILVAPAGVVHAPAEISWWFFSVGLVLWMILQTLFFYRVFFHHPLPEKLLPTLFILLAPPLVGFLAYVKLSGGLDNFARVLYYFGLFIFVFLLAQIPMLRRVRFFLSWWAYSFPLAALTIASTLMWSLTDGLFFRVLALVVFAILVVVVCALTVLTVGQVARRQICVEE
jgi:tellurite resistance protein